MDCHTHLFHSVLLNRHLLFLLVLPIGVAFGQLPKPATKADLPKILNLSHTNPVYQLERQAAVEFNKLINQYRKKNQLNQLVWNDDIWIAARNHSIYMAANGLLTHTQNKGARDFTGANINDRLGAGIPIWLDATFGPVQSTNRNTRTRVNRSYTWGENVYTQPNVSVSKNNVAEVARSIARVAFDGWKKSPGHNKNMLSRHYKSHAIAFILHQNRIYATDDFAGFIDIVSKK